MNTQTERVLPADVYDTLEFSALVYGGIGQGNYTEDDTPCCIVGHSWVASNDLTVRHGLRDAGIGVAENDAAFEPGEGRIPFSEWCRRLHVVRGS